MYARLSAFAAILWHFKAVHTQTVSVPSNADVFEAAPALGSWDMGAVGGWERWGREEPCRGAHNRLINGTQVTAIKVACQRRGSEAQRRFSAALSTAEHGKASLLLFKGTSLFLWLPPNSHSGSPNNCFAEMPTLTSHQVLYSNFKTSF